MAAFGMKVMMTPGPPRNRGKEVAMPGGRGWMGTSGNSIRGYEGRQRHDMPPLLHHKVRQTLYSYVLCFSNCPNQYGAVSLLNSDGLIYHCISSTSSNFLLEIIASWIFFISSLDLIFESWQYAMKIKVFTDENQLWAMREYLDKRISLYRQGVT